MCIPQACRLGLTVSTTRLRITEGNMGKYTVVLNRDPAADVTVAVAAPAGGDLTVSPASLSFTTSNWDTPQEVMVTVAEDSDLADEVESITHTITRATTASSASLRGGVSRQATFATAMGRPAPTREYVYLVDRLVAIEAGGAVSEASVVVTIDDDDDPDTPGVPALTDSLRLTEGHTGAYTLELGAEPTAEVTIALSVSQVGSDGVADVTVSPTSLAFTTENWDTPQWVTVSVAEDSDTVGETETISHAATSDDSRYDEIEIPPVKVVIRDRNPTRMPTGTLTASPNPCTIAAGQTTCSTTLSWTSSDTTAVQVRRIRPQQGSTPSINEIVVRSGSPDGQTTFSEINLTDSPFYLYDYSSGSRGNQLATVTVKGIKVLSLSPTSGPVGTEVTIMGSAFGDSRGTSTVTFNETAVTTYTSWSDTQIVFAVPQNATTGNKTVVVTVAQEARTIGTFRVTTIDEPTCDTFSADRTTINRGQPVTLSWTTSNATSAELDPGNISVTPVASGSKSLSPTSTTTYTLTATGSGSRTATCTVTVTVNPKPGNATIVASPNPCKIQPGQSSCTTKLSWSATGTTGLLVEVSHLTRAFASSGATGSQSAPWIQAAPANSYVFSLYDYMDRVKGAILNSVTVTGMRIEVPDPTCDTFTATPDLIDLGGSSTLSWTTSNATSVSINQGIGSVAVDGSESVSPSSKTTYTLTATGSGSRTDICTVTVKVRPRIDSFSADRTTINRGQPVTLSWTTSNATSAELDPGNISVTPVASGSKSLSPTSTTTYTLTASNDDASVSKTVKVTVKPTPPGTISASPNPCQIQPEQSSCTTTLKWSATGTTGLLVEVSHLTRAFASSGATGSQSAPWIQAAPANSYVFSLYDYMDRVQGAFLRSVTVTGNPPPQIDSFTADPSSITRGQNSTLSWETSNADSVNLSGHPLVTSADGTQAVVPWTTTSYTLTAISGSARVSETETVTVTLPPPPRISSLSRTQGLPDTQVTIYGSNFSTTQGSVSFGGSTAEINSWSDTSISVQVPVELNRGPVKVSVTALGQTSNSVDFTVTGDSPRSPEEECEEGEKDCPEDDEAEEEESAPDP